MASTAGTDIGAIFFYFPRTKAVEKCEEEATRREPTSRNGSYTDGEAIHFVPKEFHSIQKKTANSAVGRGNAWDITCEHRTTITE
jgi:hypothetical protein